MANRNRDDFSSKTVLQIAKRAGWLCSFPTCRKPTIGATSDGESEINVGTAAHICAAAPGGPRYDETMSPEERSSPKNGIWMCRDHGKAIDSTDPEFTVERLRKWKRQAEMESWQRVLRHEIVPGPADFTDEQLQTRIRSAAKDDLVVFQRTVKWPSTSVALILEVDGLNEPVTTHALADAVISLDDLILRAPPGMGKTTTIFQIAEGLLASGKGTPFVVPLGDWATEGVAVLDSILKRPALREISEDDFRKAATQPGVVLLLDGWNELDTDARRRARVQITQLKAELPEIGLVVSTRRQAQDVPFGGASVDLLPLNEDQQMQIAVAMRGDVGAKLIDQAWRTGGVRELVSIPLYLTALLSLPEQAPFPTTKEEVLRNFVSAHKKEVGQAEALNAVTKGFHQDYLVSLAVFATRTANTAIGDRNALRSISETEMRLADNGLIMSKPEPVAVLDVLVSNHMLMRAGDAPGYSFQHQQFQEWYASHFVEHRIVCEIDDPERREALKGEVLNLLQWEEPILFAVERLAHGDVHQRAVCGKAIVAAFEVDPILAAEMIFRSTEEVWMQIAATIQELVARWHALGKVDRAFRFMLTSGRPEFLDKVWPLITADNEQVSLTALRNCRRFRPSILGKDVEKKIKALPQRFRTVLLSEIAFHSGIDGLNLVSEIAKNDPDPEVQASVVDALAFRRADRHVAVVLQKASDKTFDLIATKGHVDDVDDSQVQEGIAAARKRHSSGTSDYDRLRVILSAQNGEDRSTELAELIGTVEIERRQDAVVQLIYEANKSYPKAVSDGLLARVIAGRTLFYGADDILASAGFIYEDDALLQLALADTPGPDIRAEAAASVLGQHSAGLIIDALLDTATRLRDASGKFDNAASQRYLAIQARIAHMPSTSLVAAIQERSPRADNERMAHLAKLLSRRLTKGADHARLFNAEDLASTRTLVEDWGNRMLASGNAERRQLADIADLASHAPDVSLLPLLKRMLDDNLMRFRAFREAAEASGWHQGTATHQARTPMMHEYQRAFLAIDAPETAILMREYLADPYFGELAAGVLVSQWMAANEPQPDQRVVWGVDFSRVREKRAARATNPSVTSTEAEAIFAAIDPLIADGATEDEKKHGVALGITAVQLPHGQRDATIAKLIALSSQLVRSKLLLNLILSGAEIDSELVANGIAQAIEAKKENLWILLQSNGYSLREWLRLLPFTNRPTAALEVIRSMPDTLKPPHLFHELVEGLAETPSEGGEETLFKLAEENPCFYKTRQWRTATLKLGTASAARHIGLLPVSKTLC